MSTAALHGILSSAGSRMMQRLAERGIQADLDSLPPLGEVAEALSPGDWPVVHRLLAASLGRLYGALFELDASISAALAKELLLVDAAVAPGGAAKPAEVAGSCFRIPEWRAAFRPDGRLDRRVLCRHVLILGETGSGKMASGVLPVVAAMFDPRNPFGCALVVDPKREIGASLDALERTGDVAVHGRRAENPDSVRLPVRRQPRRDAGGQADACGRANATRRPLMGASSGGNWRRSIWSGSGGASNPNLLRTPLLARPRAGSMARAPMGRGCRRALAPIAG